MIMTKDEFLAFKQAHETTITGIRQAAHDLHQSVNQIYGDDLPYGFHLDMVTEGIENYGHLVCACEDDVVPMFFGGYYHDSIEDARLTYNDVMKEAKRWMTDEQALMATEIVYALTNDKGRTRAERAGEKYYAGIRSTPYAPFVKLCDRLANVAFSCGEERDGADRMRQIYKNEMEHFLAQINPHSEDCRFKVPFEVVSAMAEILISEYERSVE
jgi:hypothetical protein